MIHMAQLERDPLENLELLSAACVLAPQVFRARGEAFGVSGEWTMLNAAERQHFIDQCIHLLRSVAPLLAPARPPLKFPTEVAK